MSQAQTDGDDGPQGRRAKRAALAAQIADVLLRDGVAQIPLRELAAKLGTSDRMLLYYFSDKADLVNASLQEVSTRLAAHLPQSALSEPQSPEAMLQTAVPLLNSKAMAPFMNVWADISARGGRAEEPFQTIARRTVEDWLLWLESRLDLPSGPERRSVAAAILSVVEGARLLEASAPGSTQGVAELLARGLAQR